MLSSFAVVARRSRLALALAAPLALGAAAALVPVTHQAQAQTQRGPQTLADLVDQVMDAVVNISAVSTSTSSGRSLPNLPQFGPDTPFGDLFEEFFNRRGGGREGQGNNDGPRQRKSQSAGSGFVIDASGLVVTNNHVIGDANEITVIFNDGQRLKAEVLGKDAKVDLALLRVKPEKPLKAVKFGDSDKVRIGDWVLAIGNPFGLGGSVSTGILSARNRNIEQGPYDNYLQTDAAINKGNSGGPLFNMAGEVIGVNTAILSPSGGSVGIGFAVPSTLAATVIDQLKEFGETRRGWLGVRIQSVDDATADALGLGKARGALIAGVDEKGPARPAGLEVGDVIVKFDGREVKESRDLPRIVAATPVGKEVSVVVLRKGKETVKAVTLGRLEDGEKLQQASANGGKEPPTPPKPVTSTVLGLELSNVTDELKKRFNLKDGLKGAVVTKVDANSTAADKRIVPGDVILEVSQEPVTAPADVAKRVEAVKKQGKKNVLLLVASARGEERFVALAVD